MLHNKIIWYKFEKSQNANIHFKWTFHHGLNVRVNDVLFELEHRHRHTHIYDVIVFLFYTIQLNINIESVS